MLRSIAICVAILGMAFGQAHAQQWYDISGGSRDPGFKVDTSEVHRCEAGYWVRYQRINYGPYQKYPMTVPCSPVGADCRWYERYLPNGAFERRFLCPVGVKGWSRKKPFTAADWR